MNTSESSSSNRVLTCSRVSKLDTPEGREALFSQVLDAVPGWHSRPWATKAMGHWLELMERGLNARWPAAKGNHHAWPGGLFFHTISVTVAALRHAHWLSTWMDDVEPDYDVIAVAGLYHDLGKLLEVNPQPGGDYTPIGGALGHLPIGMLRWSWIAMMELEVPTREHWHVLHCIAAHHSNAGTGAPQPRTFEACLISMMDAADSKVVGLLDALAKPKEERPRHFSLAVDWQQEWTEKNACGLSR